MLATSRQNQCRSPDWPQASRFGQYIYLYCDLCCRGEITAPGAVRPLRKSILGGVQPGHSGTRRPKNRHQGQNMCRQPAFRLQTSRQPNKTATAIGQAWSHSHRQEKRAEDAEFAAWRLHEPPAACRDAATQISASRSKSTQPWGVFTRIIWNSYVVALKFLRFHAFGPTTWHAVWFLGPRHCSRGLETARSEALLDPPEPAPCRLGA